jgi:hypothetical protein
MMVMSILIPLEAVATIGTTFGLERGLHLYKGRSESMEHVLDHMVGSNAKSLISNFSWQMAVPQMPSKAHKLLRVFMPDFYNKLCRSPDLQPSPMVKSQPISIGNRYRSGKIEKNIVAVIRS